MLTRNRRGGLRTALSATLALSLAAPLQAQQLGWEPNRIPHNSQAQPLSASGDRPASSGSQSAFLNSSPRSNPQSGEQLGSAVVLRWKSNTAPRQDTPTAAQVFDGGQQQPAAADYHTQVAFSNPLRQQALSAVQPANYQQVPQSSAENRAQDSSGFTFPRFPDSADVQSDPQIPLPDARRQQPDPLSSPEMPPPPNLSQPSGQGNASDSTGSILEDRRANPFPRRADDSSPRDNMADGEPELMPTPNELGSIREGSSGPLRQNANANSFSCDEARNRIQNNPLTAVSLDVSPSYGEGLRSVNKDTEQQRLDFAAASKSREWSDTRGYVIATGRLIDLRDDRVVIDVDGRERAIPLRELSDVDVAYVGESWNIPEKCGMGYQPFQAREHVASTVQWKASGLCHKPLYFEQVQLERYGHEIGPVLQPLVSTAHFFGSIPVLPYKMGIHPPNECQYALGYYRPGNCAPYMLQPIPLSLRGAAVQAAAVTGAAALIP